MSEPDQNRIRLELLLEQAINRQLDALVRRANSTAALLKANSRMEESQLRNLLSVAVESRSVEVVINFIRYQIARNGSAWGTGPGDFGHKVIDDLRGPVKALAEYAIEFVQSQAADAPADRFSQEAYTRIMQLYLGYLNRAFYYGKKTGAFDKLTEVANVG